MGRFWRPPLFSRIVLAPDRDQLSAPRINQVGARMFCREFREFRENREIRDSWSQSFIGNESVGAILSDPF